MYKEYLKKTIKGNSSPELHHPGLSIFLVPYPQNKFLKKVFGGTDKIKEELTNGDQAAICLEAAITGQAGIDKTAMAVESAYRIAADYPRGLFWLNMGFVNDICEKVEDLPHHRTKDVLCSIAYLDPDAIDPSLLAEVLDMAEIDIYTILDHLADISILKTTTTGYGIHSLIQQVIFWGNENIEWGKGISNCISQKITEINKTGRYIDGYYLIPHILHIVQQANKEQPEDEFPDVESLSNWSSYLANAGKYNSAEPIAKLCLNRVERSKSPYHPDVAQTLNNLARLYEYQGKYEKALPLYTRALKIGEVVQGPHHLDVAQTLNNLAGLYESQHKYEEAEPLYTRALRIRKTTIGSDHPDIAQTLSNLARLYYSQDKYEEALPLCTKALKIRETALGPNHPDVAETLNNLAGLYESQHKYEEAEPLYTRTLKIIEAVLGPNHPSVAITLNNLAMLYYYQGKDEEAEPLYTRALKRIETVLGPDHPKTILSKKNHEDLRKRREN
jgi:tetratricopeptide (TPR) repeat protein